MRDIFLKLVHVDIHTFDVYDETVKYKELGSLIKSEREKRGWEQVDLAARISREQQTISRWENGSSRPKQDDLLKLVDLFSGDVDTWLAKAGYHIEEPDLSLTPYLPLHNLSAENFELFCRDLVKALNPAVDVQRYGMQGHTQDGIDLFAKRGNFVQDYQCKRHKQFGPADIDDAVAKNAFQAEHHYLLLSRVASPPARKAIKNHSNWTLWDREDVAREVRSLPKDDAIRLVDTYFPGWRTRFLGVDEPSPWLTSEEFYLPLADRMKLFSHGWSFVGRQKEQKLLKEFETQTVSNALLISGRGGIGKSRLLRAWAERVSKLTSVRFVSPGSDIEPKDLELLQKGPAYLVIDDAHDRSDLLVILNGVARTRPEMKVIVSSRPYGITRLKDDLTRTGVIYDDDKIVTLNDLDVQDAKNLAQEILSDPNVGGDIQYAQRIAEITKDCPLATVIGSRLVGEGQIKPELLNNDKKFREELLRSFRNVIAGEIGGSEAEAVRALLDFLAMVQPFNPANPNFQPSIEKVLGRHFDKITRDIGALEEAGVLLRRGSRLRIVPDLLADYIRATASYDEKNQKPTGYADRVFNLIQSELATNLLVNMCQLDWRLSADGLQSSLLQEVWTNLKDQFRKAKIIERSSILEALTKVAYYQPDHTIDFVRLALEEPTDEMEEEAKKFIFTEPSYRMVLEKIPSVLKYIAYNADYLIEALDILKQLAEKDERATNPHPDHPLRVLQDLASIEPGKPVAYNEIIASHVLEWLEQDSSGRFSPFDVLDQLLQTEGHQSATKGITITMTAFKVNPEVVSGLRQRIIDAAFKKIAEKSLKNAMRALKTISASLSYPSGILGQSITTTDRAAWDPGILAVLNRLEAIVTNPKVDPFIAVEVRGDVSWHSTWGSEATKAAAKKVLAAIPSTLDHEVSRAIVDSWGWTFEKDDGSAGRSEIALIEWRKKLVAKLLSTYKNDLSGLIQVLEERVLTLNNAESTRHSDAGPFLAEIMEHSPDFTELLGKHLLSKTSSPLVDWFGAVISVMAKQDRNASLALVKEGLNKNDDVITRCISRGMGWGQNLEVIPDEIEIIKSIAHSTDPWVRRNIVRVVKRFPKDSKSIALDILLSIDITDSMEIADEVLGEFEERHGTFKTSDLADDQLQALLDALVKCPSIDDYHISLFLGLVSFTHPEMTLKLLTDRVEYKEANEKLEPYTPLPYSWRRSESLRFHETPKYGQVLRSARDWATMKTGSWIRFHYGADLFKLVSAGFDQVTLEVLEEWIISVDEHQLEAAAALLSEAPNTFVWVNQQFVVNLLEQAQKLGSTCYKRVCSSLHTSVIQGGKSGTPGQPFPEDIAQRDRSYEAMSTLPPGSPAHRFYKMLHEEAKVEIERHTIEDFEFE